jgi:undecaprenyl-diphosphatase
MQQLILLDQSLSASLNTFVANNAILATLAKIAGVGLVYVIPLLLIFVWFVYSRKLALRAFIAGVLAWEGLSKVIAAIVDRPRPSFSQIGTQELVFHRPDTSFPSDHSAFLFAVALTFYLSGQRNLGHLVLAIAILVGVARVGIGVHYPADIAAGWIVGAIVAFLIHAIEQPLDKVLEPVIAFARRFRL